MSAAVVHAVPGRLRLRLARDVGAAAAAVRRLERAPGITGVRLNRAARSLVVGFDVRRLDTDGVLAELRAALGGDVAHPPHATRLTMDGLAARGRRRPSTAHAADDDADRAAAAPPHDPHVHAWPAGLGETLHRVAGRVRSAADHAAGAAGRALGGGGDETARGPADAPRGDDPRAAAFDPSRRPDAPDWHARSVASIVELVETDARAGLAAGEASDRLARHGRNDVELGGSRPAIDILIEQFASLPVAMLAGSAVLSIATGGVVDAVAILAVVGINAAVGYATEAQAERTLSAMFTIDPPHPTVLRDGERVVIDPAEVVPGDVLVLGPGTWIAADARIVECADLTVDESTLTGESLPVEKRVDAVERADVPIGERRCVVHRGTVVTGGSGRAVVVATGGETEVGRIQVMVGEARPPETPMQRQLGHLGTQLGIGSLAICGGVFVLGLVRGTPVLEMLKIASSLAVAAVPEGLPMVATTTLALGVRSMRRHNVVVRHLDAVETLGAVRYFCLDKTGTITRNRMAVRAIAVAGHALEVADDAIADVPEQAEAALERLLEVAVLNSEVELGEDGALLGSPTETALVRLARARGVDPAARRDRRPRRETQARSEARPYMATLHAAPDGEGEAHPLLAVKGRPRTLLDMCDRVLEGGSVRPLTESDREAIIAANDRMTGRALRVLGFAYRESGDVTAASDHAHGLIWLGLAGIADPVRPGIAEVIESFHRAGIDPVMLTGDQSGTAAAVAEEVGIAGDRRLDVLDSSELERLDPEVLRGLAARTDVFSAISPSHKLQIVKALQDAGHVVAMTGDGVNDGPALKAADIGVAMGGERGSEVARTVADVVLEDDELATMIEAIRRGRAIHANTRQAISYLLATNGSEIMVTTAAVAAGAGQPLSSLQLLWINLVSDVFPVLALAVQPPDSDVLDHPPRPSDEPLLRPKDLRRVGRESVIITLGSLTSFVWGLMRHGRGPSASTMAFTTVTTSQLFHMLASHSDGPSLLREPGRVRNGALGAAFVGGLGLQALTLLPPLRRLLGGGPVGPLDLLFAMGCAGAPLLINEAIHEVEQARRGDADALLGTPDPEPDA